MVPMIPGMALQGLDAPAAAMGTSQAGSMAPGGLDPTSASLGGSMPVSCFAGGLHPAVAASLGKSTPGLGMPGGLGPEAAAALGTSTPGLGALGGLHPAVAASMGTSTPGLGMPAGLHPAVAAAMGTSTPGLGMPAGLNLGTSGPWMPSTAPGALRLMMPSADDALKGPLLGQAGASGLGACGQQTARFIFRPRTGRINWRLLHSLDLDRVVREGDVEILQAHLDNITFSRFGREDLEVTSDECLIKVVQLAQLCMEFLCSMCLSSQQLMQGLVEKVRVQTAQLKAWEARGGHRRSATTNHRTRRRSKSNEREKRELQAAAAQVAPRKCVYCPKRFQTDQFLHEHMLRRHSAEMFAMQQAQPEKPAPAPPAKSEVVTQCPQPEPTPSFAQPPPPPLQQQQPPPDPAATSEEVAKALRTATAGLQEQLQTVQHAFSDQLLLMRQDMGKVVTDVNRVAEDMVKMQQVTPVQQALPPPAPPLPRAEAPVIDPDAIERRLESRVSDLLESSQKMLLARIEEAVAAQRAAAAGGGAGTDGAAQAEMQQEMQRQMQQFQQFQQDIRTQLQATAEQVRDAARPAAAAAQKAAPVANARRSPSPDAGPSRSSTPPRAPPAATQDPAALPSGRTSEPSQQQQQRRPSQSQQQPQQQQQQQQQQQPQPQQQPQQQPQPKAKQQQRQEQQQTVVQQEATQARPPPSDSAGTESAALASVGQATPAAEIGAGEIVAQPPMGPEPEIVAQPPMGPEPESPDFIGQASPAFSSILESGLSMLQTEEDRLRFMVSMTQERTRPIGHGADPTELESQWTRALQPDDAGLAGAPAPEACARCPNGHEVQPSQLARVWKCDGCGKASGKQPGCAPCRRSRPPKVPRFRCEACNYDLCEECCRKAKEASPPPAGEPGQPPPGAGEEQAQQLALPPPEPEALDMAGNASPGFNGLLEKNLSALQTEEEKLRFTLAMTQERTRPVGRGGQRTELEREWSRSLNPEDASLGHVSVPAPEARVCCPNQHHLAPSKLAKDWSCDSCSRRSKQFKKMQRFRCNECDYDLCDECVAKEKKALERSASRGPDDDIFSADGFATNDSQDAPAKEQASKESSGLHRALRALSCSRTSEASGQEEKKKKRGVSCFGRSKRKDTSGDADSSAAKRAAAGIDESSDEDNPTAAIMQSLPDVTAASASQAPPPPPPIATTAPSLAVEVRDVSPTSSSEASEAGFGRGPPLPPPASQGHGPSLGPSGAGHSLVGPGAAGPSSGPEASFTSSRGLQPAGGFGPGPAAHPAANTPRAAEAEAGGRGADVDLLDAGASMHMSSLHSRGSLAQGAGLGPQAADAMGTSTPDMLGGHAAQRSVQEVSQSRPAHTSGQVAVEEVEEFRPGRDLSSVSLNSDHTNAPRQNPDTQVQQFNMSTISDEDSDAPRLPVAARSGLGSEHLGTPRASPQATAVQAMSPPSDSDSAPAPRGAGAAREVTEVSSFQSAGARPTNVRPAAQQPPAERTAVRELSVDSASDDDDIGIGGGWTGVGVRVARPAPAAVPPVAPVRGINQDSLPLDNSGVKPFSPGSGSSSPSPAREPLGQQGAQPQRDRSISQLMEESL